MAGCAGGWLGHAQGVQLFELGQLVERQFEGSKFKGDLLNIDANWNKYASTRDG